MKKVVVGLLVVVVLLIGFVGAESNETELGDGTESNETELGNETEVVENVSDEEEPIPCPSIIGWRIEDDKCIEDSGCDYDSLKYTYYSIKEKCENELQPEPSGSSGGIESEICIEKIEVNFDKDVYYIGDEFEAVMELFDSQGNRVPHYDFYFQTYTYEPDGMWHTPSEERTDESGYRIYKGVIERAKMTLGKTRHRVYVEAHDNCPSVEDIVEMEVKERTAEPVPCGMGNCVPIKEVPKESIKIPDEKVFYSCNGCELEDKCYPVGYRKKGEYCSIDDGGFVSQVDKVCDNNFECKSNLCLSGECVGESLMKRAIKWFRKMFGGDENEGEEEPNMCSKLLVEKDIGDNDYIKTEYGSNEHTQIPVHSEDGENIGTVKCCAADYSTGMVMVCPLDSEEEVRNSLRWILGGGVTGSYEFDEYNGERVINVDDNGIFVWTSKNYLIASGGKPGVGGKVVEDVVDVYLKKYSSDLDLTADDIPYVLNPREPSTWVSCVSDKDMLTEECHFVDDFESGLKQWTFSRDGTGYEGTGEVVVEEDGNTVMRLVGVNRANVHRIWDNYLFKFRFKMVEGNVHVDFRREEIPEHGARRYVVSINDQEVSNLNREINQDFQKLEDIDLKLDDGWHALEVRVYGDVINVYVDNKLVAKHKDVVSPLSSGWVRFEAHNGGRDVIPEFLVDDVEIRLITEEDIIYP